MNVRLLTSFTTFLILIPTFLVAQTTDHEKYATRSSTELNVRFLSSDILKGRDTGSEELKIAARYIESWFTAHGIQKAPGYHSYSQLVPLERRKAPVKLDMVARDSLFSKNEDMILLNSFRGEVSAPVILIDYGTQAEIESHDLNGKIVVAKAGFPNQQSPREQMMSSPEKLRWIQNAGAAGLVELYSNPQYPWRLLVNYIGRERIALKENEQTDPNAIPHIWMQSVTRPVATFFEEYTGKSARIMAEGNRPEDLTSQNMIGFIEGNDPDLKDEIILLSAHYDHVGVRPASAGQDSIYNGARDNAVGTSAIMAAGKHFAEHPPRRSILIAAWTAEEKGLLGSGWFAEHPVVPLQNIVYNVNIDGAGYNDTDIVTVVGLGRTEADSLFISAAKTFGLEAIADPDPRQNLFNRSDNVHFARSGIPSPTYSMGFTSFDDEINRYYHRVTDEAETLDFDYVTRYVNSYILAVQKIANIEEAPFWNPGDEYEEAGIRLYQKEQSTIN